jgi:hypothetical protein
MADQTLAQRSTLKTPFGERPKSAPALLRKATTAVSIRPVSRALGNPNADERSAPSSLHLGLRPHRPNNRRPPEHPSAGIELAGEIRQ